MGKLKVKSKILTPAQLALAQQDVDTLSEELKATNLAIVDRIEGIYGHRTTLSCENDEYVIVIGS